MNLADWGGPSLRTKLLVLVAAAVGLALLLSGAALVVYDVRSYRQQWAWDLTAQADVLGSTSSAAIVFDDPKAAQEYLRALRHRPRVRAAAIYLADGRRFAAYTAEGEWPAPERRGPNGLSMGPKADLVIERPVMQNGEVIGWVAIRADLSTRARVLGYLGVVLLLSILASAAALTATRSLQSSLLAPILEVAAVARKVVRERDYGTRAEGRTRDEVGLLVEAFNEMLDQIQMRQGDLKAANAALATEIADHKAARAEVDALNQELERRVAERTAELESFSYSVSHDLRAPLRSIDGFTALLEKAPALAKDEESRTYMARVRGATQRMGQLIDDLLQLSRTSRTELRPRVLDLSAMAEDILRDLAEASPERKVRWRVQPGVVVHADGLLMRAALENLLGNAWKFTARRPEAHIEFGAQAEGARLVCHVKDDGAGFDMRFAGKLFIPFQRLHSRAEFEGSGVGLANVQRIVRRHGGEVWCEGEEGRGAVFYFALPLHKEVA